MSRKNVDRRAQVRAFLLTRPDGERVYRIAESLDVEASAVRGALKGMADAYIDRWEKDLVPGGYAPVWCVVPVPEHCPRPTHRRENRQNDPASKGGGVVSPQAR